MGRRGRVVASLAGLVGLRLVGSLGPWVLVRAEAAGRVLAVAEVEPQEVALVLGAQVYADGTPSPYLRGRLDRGAELYRAGKVKVILVSGDNAEATYNEPDAMRGYLIASGIPESDVVADYAGFDTYDSCVRARKIFGVDRLVVVTQSYHLPRAIATCRLVGVDAVGVGDDSPVRDATWTYGSRRELLANYKMVWDVVSRRTPTLGRYETSVDDALTAR